jgi:hypothetical protein
MEATMKDDREFKEEIISEFFESKKSYHSPLPKKRQRTSHHRGRCGKCKVYTEEEIFLYKLQNFKPEEE